MLLLIISSYTFVLDYLLLPPEYIDEWPLLKAERTRGANSYTPYVLSCLLTETPRGLVHSLLTLTTTYIFHGLNPNGTLGATSRHVPPRPATSRHVPPHEARPRPAPRSTTTPHHAPPRPPCPIMSFPRPTFPQAPT